MPTLILSSLTLSAELALANAARRIGWTVFPLDERANAIPEDPLVWYVSTEVAETAAARFHLALLEPPLDVLARLPRTLLLREVQFARFADLSRLKGRAFVKPADPLNKCFDAGIYSSVRDISSRRRIDPDTQVLVADPVEFVAEYRCFVCDGEVVASSPYLSFGRPNWKPWGQGGEKAVPSKNAVAVCARLLADRSVTLPPAFVVDVGMIEDRGWAVVELNPAWSSGLLGANPDPIPSVLQRVCLDARTLTVENARWVIDRRARSREKQNISI